MHAGSYRTRDGQHVTVRVTKHGNYIITYANGKTVIIGAAK